MKMLLSLVLAMGMCLTLLPVSAQEEQTDDPWQPAKHFATRKMNVTYGRVEYMRYPSTTTGTERKVKIILPPDYDPQQQYPVLYLLHGIGGDHNEWMNAQPEIVIGNLIATGEAPPMITVLPNVRARANDAANPKDIYTPAHFAAFDNFINDLTADLMPFVKATFSVKEGRENTAIAGLSMGGREALYIGLMMPETFGYVGAFCPAPGVLPYAVEKGLFATEEFRAAEGYDTFILINAGATDGVVGDWPRTYSETLAANGTEHIFYVATGGHDFNVWRHGLYHFVRSIFD